MHLLPTPHLPSAPKGGRNYTCYAVLLTASMLVSGCQHMPSWLGGYKKVDEKLAGERITVLSDHESALKPDESLSSLPISLPQAQTLAQWPQHGGSETAHVEHPALNSDLQKRTSAKVGKGAAFEQGEPVSPVIANGLVFAMDAKGAISAHDATDISKIRWVIKGVSGKEDSIPGGGLAYAEGVLYAASGRGAVAAFKPDSGEQLWRQDLGIPVRAAPRVDDGNVFITAIDSQLFALNGKDGKVKWNHRGINEGASFLSHASPAVANGVVIAPYASGEVFALNELNGAEGWSDSLSMARRTSGTGLFSDISANPVIVGNALYVAGNAGIIGAYRLDNGQRVWEQTASTSNPLWVAGNALFFVSSENILTALNRMDGRVYWATQLPQYKNNEQKKGYIRWSGPTLAGGKLYVAGDQGELQAFSPDDGSQLTSVAIVKTLYTPPVIAADAIYMVGADAKLHMLY